MNNQSLCLLCIRYVNSDKTIVIIYLFTENINDSDKEFWQQRIQAMNMMVEVYGHFPLKTSNIFVYNP